MIRHYISAQRDAKKAPGSIKSTSKSLGFTIVEMLVIIIIIAILVTITVISYSAVTTNAKKQTTKTDAQTMATALNRYKADNGAFPSSLDQASTTAKVDSTFQYHYNNSDDTYCLTASVKGASAYVISGNSLAQEGGCPGDGVNGEAPITNLAINPSAEAGTSGVSGYFSSPVSRVSGGAVSGSYIFSTTTNSTTSSQGLIHQVTPVSEAGHQYTCSISLKGTVGSVVAFGGRFTTSTGTYISENAGAKNVTLSSSWQRATITFTSPATTGIVLIQYRLLSPATNITIQSDALLCTEGTTTYNFADGNSPSWIWNGTQNASSSTGPAL